MTVNWKHWCPIGCGKQVVHNRVGMRDNIFKCLVCRCIFTREEIEKYRKSEYNEQELYALKVLKQNGG